MKHARLELGSAARHSQDDQRKTKDHALPAGNPNAGAGQALSA